MTAHREQGRAVARRTQLERIETQLRYYESWARAMNENQMVPCHLANGEVYMHDPERLPMLAPERRQIEILRIMREDLLEEMRAAGQIAPENV